MTMADTSLPLRCPTVEESTLATLAILPRGRAWPANDGGGRYTRLMQWLSTRGPQERLQDQESGFVQTGFFAAIGNLRNQIELRACDLVEEFFCATQSETNDQWMLEYGLPDGCDPFPDLCLKVAAQGGANCEFYSDIAERAGWSIGCSDVVGDCGAQAGCDFAGNAIAGTTRRQMQLLIEVDIAKSPAYIGAFEGLPVAGCAQAGGTLACFPDITALKCLIDRIAQAHVEIIYHVIPPPTYIMIDDDTHLAGPAGALMVA